MMCVYKDEQLDNWHLIKLIDTYLHVTPVMGRGGERADCASKQTETAVHGVTALAPASQSLAN